MVAQGVVALRCGNRGEMYMDKGVVAQGVVARYGVVAGKRTELTGTQERTEQVGSHAHTSHLITVVITHTFSNPNPNLCGIVGTDKSNP